MSLRHITEYLPAPATRQRSADTRNRRKQLEVLRMGQIAPALIEAKNLAKELLALIELLEIEVCPS